MRALEYIVLCRVLKGIGVAVIVLILLGVVGLVWLFAYTLGRASGARAGAELASRNIAVALAAEEGGVRRVMLTAYPSNKPCSIAPGLVQAVLPIEHDATALILRDGIALELVRVHRVRAPSESSAAASSASISRGI